MKTSFCGFRWAFLVLAVAAWFRAAALGAETLESVEQSISEKWEKIKSLSYDKEMRSVMQGGGTVVTTAEVQKVELLRDGAKTKINLSSKSSMETTREGKTDKTEMANTAVVDGEVAYALMEAFGKQYVTKLKPESYTDAIGFSGGKALLKTLHFYQQLALLPDEMVDGKAAYVIQGKDKPVQVGSLTVKYYFSQENGLLIQSIATSPPPSPAYTAQYGDQKISTTMKLLNLKIDPSLPAAHFVFTAPAGAVIQDLMKQDQ